MSDRQDISPFMGMVSVVANRRPRTLTPGHADACPEKKRFGDAVARRRLCRARRHAVQTRVTDLVRCVPGTTRLPDMATISERTNGATVRLHRPATIAHLLTTRCAMAIDYVADGGEQAARGFA
jgi:hypothetical protein